jgi:hypothetical protein
VPCAEIMAPRKRGFSWRGADVEAWDAVWETDGREARDRPARIAETLVTAWVDALAHTQGPPQGIATDMAPAGRRSVGAISPESH